MHIIGVDPRDAGDEGRSGVTCIVNASSGETMACRESECQQCHLAVFSHDLDCRGRLDEQSHGFGGLFRVVLGLGTLPRQGAVDLTENARRRTGLQITTARQLNQMPGLGVPWIANQQSPNEDPGI